MNKVLETDEKKAMDAAITDAAKEWVRTFTSIPQAIVEKLLHAGEPITEVTPIEGEDFDVVLPMWGTMWSFSNFLDEEWLNNKENRKIMMEFLMIPALLGISTYGLYAIVELFVRRRERLTLIEKLGSGGLSGDIKGNFKGDISIESSSRFGSLKWGWIILDAALLGIAAALIIILAKKNSEKKRQNEAAH